MKVTIEKINSSFSVFRTVIIFQELVYFEHRLLAWITGINNNYMFIRKSHSEQIQVISNKATLGDGGTFLLRVWVMSKAINNYGKGNTA